MDAMQQVHFNKEQQGTVKSNSLKTNKLNHQNQATRNSTKHSLLRAIATIQN